jgi:Raf kinase inhibitor-like YbhB/YbcL family protein
MRHILITMAILVAAGCSGPGDVTPTASLSSSPAAVSGFAVTSPDFADGGELGDWATASALGGQCTGDNLNPALAWTGAPEGTRAFAIVMLDRSANNFIHWVHVDIPADMPGVDRGASIDLPGADGANQASGTGYFGPCPPGPDHRYEFTVYALDDFLGVGTGVRFADLKPLLEEHALATATITGMRSGPA